LTHRDFIAIGTSLGGVDALRSIASTLPRDFPATIAVVLHVGAHGSVLPALLSDAGPLPAFHAEDGEAYMPGRIYIAPPDRHLVIEGARLRLVRGAKENFTRPAIDPLFRSVATQIGTRAVGVILTGMLDDGAAGLEAIQSCGGATVVQDPGDAFAAEMPRRASPFADHVLPLAEVGPFLVGLTGSAVPAPATDDVRRVAARQRTGLEQRAWLANPVPTDELRQIAIPSTYTCPECNGTLWRLNDSRLLRYRCHTGHAYSAMSLADGRRRDVEHSLRDTLRALHEQELMSRELSEHFARTGDAQAQRREELAAQRAASAAGFLQSMLLESDPDTG
jgi:two-component system, chemotaxis family, protein-glutamate methylesterase/glutaminase